MTLAATINSLITVEGRSLLSFYERNNCVKRMFNLIKFENE